MASWLDARKFTLVVKCKKESAQYRRLLETHRNLIFDDSFRGDLSAALASVVAVGPLNSTPVLLGAIHGTRAIFLDFANNIWEPLSKDLNTNIAKSSEQLFEMLESALEGEFARPNVEVYDPFADELASVRIAKTIQSLIINSKLSKAGRLRVVCEAYADQWGQSSVNRFGIG